MTKVKILTITLCCLAVIGVIFHFVRCIDSREIEYSSEYPAAIDLEPEMDPERKLVRRLWKEAYRDAAQSYTRDSGVRNVQEVTIILFNARMQLLMLGDTPLE